MSDLRYLDWRINVPDDNHVVLQAKLANVERLLIEGMEATGTSSLTYKKMEEALAEIRAVAKGLNS